jgi:outer membrane protein assembly factor BamB
LRKYAGCGTKNKVIHAYGRSTGSPFTVILTALMTILLLPLSSSSLFAEDAASGDSPLVKRIAAGGRITGAAFDAVKGSYWFASRDRYLYRFRPGDEIPRRTGMESRPLSAPAAGPDGRIYIACEDGTLFASTPGAAGAWKLDLHKRAVGKPAAGADGTVYAATETPELVAVALSGAVRWKIPLPSVPVSGPLLMSGSGAAGETLITVSCEDGRSYAFDTGGNRRWMFISAGRVSAPVTDGSRLYLPTEAATVAAVSSSGTLLWERRLSAPAAVSSIDPVSGILFTADTGGTITSIQTGTGEPNWSRSAGRSIRSLLAFPGAPQRVPEEAPPVPVLALSSEDGGLLWLDPEGNPVAQMEMPPPGADIAADEKGRLLYGGSDWVFYLLDPRGDLPRPSLQADEDTRGSSAFSPPRGDRIYLESIADGTDRSMQLQTVNAIGERLSSTVPDRSGAYLAEVLHRFASAGVLAPVKENGRLLNDFPEVRIASLELLGRYGTLNSSILVSVLLKYEWDFSVRIAAYGALSSLLDTAEGPAIKIVRSRLAAINRSRNDETEAAAAAETLFRLAAYHGELTEEDLTVLLPVAYGPFGRETRRKVLDSLRHGGKRRLY